MLQAEKIQIKLTHTGAQHTLDQWKRGEVPDPSNDGMLLAAEVVNYNLTGTELVEGVFAIQNCQLGQTKTGKPFIKCLLADKTGRTPGRMWNASQELFSTLPTDGFGREYLAQLIRLSRTEGEA